MDFTIEVERSLRVLDGAILVLCGVSGVQSQSLTVDRQMKRYGVPRLTFINKLDRAGSDPWRVIKQVESKLGLRAAAIHVPIGLESDLSGIIDVISNEAIYYDGDNGEHIRREKVPDNFKNIVAQKRKELIETLADVDEIIGDKFLMEEEISNDDICQGIRRATLLKSFSPVMMGSALKNTGVQTLLDGIIKYLPNPSQRRNYALKRLADNKNEEDDKKEKKEKKFKEEKIILSTDSSEPLVSLAFKLEENRFGQLTYVRIYQGTLSRGDIVVNTRTGKKVKVPRLVRMHSNEMEEIQESYAGDICAMFGLECASGDTFVSAFGSASTSQQQNKYEPISMESLYVPEPVMSLAVKPKNREMSGGFSKALSRFLKEDPTFRVFQDNETNETVISGMGELHLQIYIERMKREYKCELEVGPPRVNYRETILAKRSNFTYLHKKQSGGSGQFAGLEGYLESIDDNKSVEFKNLLIGNNVPPDFLPAIEKGFHEALREGTLTGHRVQGIRMCIVDGRTHAVDSNELAFRMASIMGFRQAFDNAKPCVLEPVMKVDVEIPTEYQGTVMSGLAKRRGIINNSTGHGDYGSIAAEVPLAQMFGYSTELRSMTQGKGEYTMEYLEHRILPDPSHLIEVFQEKVKAGR